MKCYTWDLFLWPSRIWMQKKKSYNTMVDCNKSIWCAEGGKKVIQMFFYWCCIASYFRQSQILRPTSRDLRGRTGNKIHKQKYYRVVVQDGLRTRSILTSHRTVSRIISIHLGCQQTCILGCLIFTSKAITTQINKLIPYVYWEIKKECPVTCRGVTMHNLKLMNY